MKFAKIRNVKSPVRGTGKAAGIDFFVPNFGSNKGFIVNPGTDVLIPSDIKMEIPEGYMLMAADKSGVVTSKWACIMANRKPKPEAFESIVILGAKIVDEDYQGEIHIHLVNVGKAKVHNLFLCLYRMKALKKFLSQSFSAVHLSVVMEHSGLLDHTKD